MGLMFLFLVGATCGWLAAIVMHAEDLPGLQRNIGAGIVGALLSGLLVSPLAGRGSLLAETYPVSAIMLSLIGALLATVCVNLFRIGQPR